MKTLQAIALILTVIGAINWGLIGLLDFDFVAALFGGADGSIARVIYTLVGIAGLVNIKLIFELFENAENRNTIK
jgi:uncharacterized membrane protein YuzA (DUF378 family)